MRNVDVVIVGASLAAAAAAIRRGELVALTDNFIKTTLVGPDELLGQAVRVRLRAADAVLVD